jgi:hypothetical protein
MTHTGVGTTQKYREKVIEQGKVRVCVYTHTVYIPDSNRPPQVPISLLFSVERISLVTNQLFEILDCVVIIFVEVVHHMHNELLVCDEAIHFSHCRT